MSLRRALLAALGTLIGASVLAPRAATATQRFGPFELSGNLQSQNLVRHPEYDKYEFIQNRNTARIRLDYDWLEGGKFMSRYSIPFIRDSKLFILYRGVYDSVYDTTPGFIEKDDIHGDAYGIDRQRVYAFGRANGVKRDAFTLEGLSNNDRQTLRFENALREAYVDVRFRQIPLSVRAGRQQVVWGETDNFRMLDRVNSLNLTWHFFQELPSPAFGWDDIRRPFWMIKFLYEIGDVWKLSQSFLEWYWNPGDWYPAKQAFLPRPWGLRFLDPLTNPVDGVFLRGVCEGSSVRFGPNGSFGRCTRLMNNTVLFKRGDYDREPFDNSQAGVRYHGITPFGFEFTLNYFYQRWAGDDGTNYAPLRGLPLPFNDPATAQRNIRLHTKLIKQGIFPAEFYAPYVHTLGMSGNYSDETYTQSVLRFETIYDVGIPFFDVAKETTIDNPALPGITKKNMWKGMIAFDRPTWMRWLNKKSTVFLTGQFFWHYMVNNPGCEAQKVAQMSAAGKAQVGSCLVGGLDLPSRVRTGSVNSGPAFRDKIRDWETLFTLAGFTFYRGGSIVPVLGIAVDASNQWAMEPFWTVDYVVRSDFVVNLAQRYMVNPRGKENIFSTWGLAGLNTGRSETSLRLTYQF
jgi:hypothetical protein